jgi:hypothetical protein
MRTLNRNFSPNVLHLELPEKCCVCGHNIDYSSKTYFKETGLYIGLDCWEKEKQLRKLEYTKQIEIEKQQQHEIDLNSIHFGNVGEIIKVRVKLERSIWIYDSVFGYSTQSVYLNIFRTDGGNIVVYKGNCLLEKYVESCFPTTMCLSKKYMDYVSLYSILDECHQNNEFSSNIDVKQMIDFFEQNVKYISNSEDDENRGYKKDVRIIIDGIYVTLTGTIKENQIYNDIKQTLIQRPKLT